MATRLDWKLAQRLVVNAPFHLPLPLQRIVAGKPIVLDGLTLDPQMQIVGRFLDLAQKNPNGRSAATVRAEFDILSVAVDRADPPMARIVDLTIPGPRGPIPATIYVPFGAKSSAPAVVYFHGGGFCVGSRKTHEGLCHRIADGSKAIVVSIDYRLAPEHPFPAGIEDAFAGYAWTTEHGAAHGIDPSRVAVAGDSAGGNFATVVSLLARDAKLRAPRAQWLIYPVTRFGVKTESRRLFGKGFLLTTETLAWFDEQYLPNKNFDDFRASPLVAPALEGLPPALVTTAGFDPLRDEGETYAARLMKSGVRTTLRRHDSLIHGFANMRFSAASRAAVDEGIDWLKTELA